MDPDACSDSTSSSRLSVNNAAGAEDAGNGRALDLFAHIVETMDMLLNHVIHRFHSIHTIRTSITFCNRHCSPAEKSPLITGISKIPQRDCTD